MRYAIKHKLCYITKQPFAVEVKKINSGKWRKKMGKNVSVALKVRQDGQQYDDSRMRKKNASTKRELQKKDVAIGRLNTSIIRRSPILVYTHL